MTFYSVPEPDHELSPSDRAVLERAFGRRAPRKPRSVKVEDDLWTAAHAKAAERGEVLSEVIREALKRYVAKK